MLNVTLGALGALAIQLGGQPWLEGGAISIRHHAQWYSSDCSGTHAPGKCLPLLAAVPEVGATGTDSIGAFEEVSLAWSAQRGAPPLLVTAVRAYAAAPDVAVLTQQFPQGLSPGNKDGSTGEIVSAFPTLGRSHLDLGVVDYVGVQLQNSHFFRWSAGMPFGESGETMRAGKSGSMPTRSQSAKSTDGDGGSMPLLLTAADGGTLLASPLEDFFTACQTQSQWVGNYSFGLQGTLSSVPAGHTHATLLVGGDGVRAATMRWGELLMQSAGGGKRRSMNWTLQGDPGLRSLSYYTDNGEQPRPLARASSAATGAAATVPQCPSLIPVPRPSARQLRQPWSGCPRRVLLLPDGQRHGELQPRAWAVRPYHRAHAL